MSKLTFCGQNFVKATFLLKNYFPHCETVKLFHHIKSFLENCEAITNLKQQNWSLTLKDSLEVSLDPNIGKIDEGGLRYPMMASKPTSAPASPCPKSRTSTGKNATCRKLNVSHLCQNFIAPYFKNFDENQSSVEIRLLSKNRFFSGGLM